jgi:MFS family permease
MRSLGLLSIAHAVNHAQAVLLPLIFLAIIAEFGVGVDTIAFLSALGAFLAGVVQLSYAGLTRAVSRRRLLGFGGILFGGGFAAQALATSFPTFAIPNIVARIGSSPQHPVGNGLLAEQFPPERRGFAISAHIAGGNVGTVVFGVIATGAVAIYGWRTSVLWLGIAAAVVGLAVYLFIREAQARPAATAHERPRVRDAYRQVIRDRDLRWLFLSSVLGGGARGLGVLNVFVPLYLTKVVGVDAPTLGAMYAVLLAASVPGPLVAGYLSDKLGRKPLIVTVYTAGAVGLALFVGVGADVTLLWGAIVFLSIFSFVESPQLQALLADISPPAIRDAAYSTYFALAFGVGSMWGLVYGGIIAATGEQQGLGMVFLVMAAATLGAALAVLPIRLSRP